MKIQLDSVQKIIRVEENVNLGELVKYLDKLLPKNSQIGYWKDFTLETNTVIYNWSNPIIYDYNTFPKWWLNPIYPTIAPLTYSYCINGVNTITEPNTISATQTNTVYNFELN